MHERTNIQLSRADRSKLEAVVANRNSPQKHAWRAKIVLLTADGRGTAEIMLATGNAKTAIWRWQERFRDEGAAGLWRDKTRRSEPRKRRIVFSIAVSRPRLPAQLVSVSMKLRQMFYTQIERRTFHTAWLAGPPSAASHWTGSAMAEGSRD